MKLTGKATVIGSVAALLVGVGAGAYASPTLAGPRAELEAALSELGVSPSSSESLVAKWEAGIAWESLTQGAEPVTSATTYAAGTATTREVFADGSVTVTVVDLPAEPAPGGVGPRALTGCVYASGNSYQANYVGCKVHRNSGVVNAYFLSDYTKFNGSARINATYDRYVKIIGGSASDISHSVTRKNSTSTQPAAARLTWQVTTFNNLVSGTMWLEFRVSHAGTPSQAQGG